MVAAEPGHTTMRSAVRRAREIPQEWPPLRVAGAHSLEANTL